MLRSATTADTTADITAEPYAAMRKLNDQARDRAWRIGQTDLASQRFDELATGGGYATSGLPAGTTITGSFPTLNGQKASGWTVTTSTAAATGVTTWVICGQ